jgi:hypothetical protein
MVVRVPGATVMLHWRDQTLESKTAKDGFLSQSNGNLETRVQPGLYKVKNQPQ